MVKQGLENRLANIASAILIVIFGLIVFHAPLSVFFGRYFDPLLVKSWKEIILLLLLPIVIFVVWRLDHFFHFSRDLLLKLILFMACFISYFCFCLTPILTKNLPV